MSEWWIEHKRDRRSSRHGATSTIAALKPTLPEILRQYGCQFEDKPDWQAVRCPFHHDTRPSASLNLTNNRFNCHTCFIQGDVLDVVMEVEGLTIGDAKQWIQERTV